MEFDEALKSNLQRAVETHKQEAITSLSKSELVFYLDHLYGTEPPADHPSEYAGQVSKEKVQEWAQILGDYVERTGGDALDATVIESDEGDSEASEASQESDNEESEGEQSDNQED